jgi:hypothetical protein
MPTYVNVKHININTEEKMELVHRLDEYGKPAWITIMILGFVIFWPIGLAILGYLIWSKRMGCSSRRNFRNNFWGDSRGGSSGSPDGSPSKGMKAWARHTKPSGNRAFDEYREETMQRLEEEFEEFQGFLGQLRAARDMKSRKKTVDAAVDTDSDEDDFPVETKKSESKGDWPPV